MSRERLSGAGSERTESLPTMVGKEVSTRAEPASNRLRVTRRPTFAVN